MDILASEALNQVLLVLVLSVIFFGISIFLKKNSVADIFWGLTFIFVSTVTLFSQNNITPPAVVVLILIWVWGVRLSFYILKRSIGKREDIRYKELAKSWGRNFYLRSYFQVFLLQGFLALLVLSPATIIFISKDYDLGLPFFLGVIIWMTGFLFESVGDLQLARFIKNPKNKGKIMTEGLWRYTRHPNYFGESLMWWGIFVISIPGGLFWISLIGPVVITILLTKVSGIPMTEKHFEGRPGWDEYKRKTSPFLPWFPKNN